MVLWIVTILLLIIIISIISYFAYIYYKNYQKELRKNIIDIVQDINKANFYTYNFDKQQENNITTMEENINAVMNNYSSLKNEIGKIKRDYVAKDTINKKIETDSVHVKNLYIGDTAFTRKARADGSNWLFLYNGGKFTGGMEMSGIKTNNADFGTAKVRDRLSVDGDTIINGKLIASGQGGLCVGKVCLKESNGVLQACNSSFLSCKNIS